MATISKRSMSQTLRPLSEMWDANGRIRPPQEEPQDPLTPEEEVRAENVRMTAAKQKEAVADEKLNSDIETFIKDPERFEGAEVRRADFGVREFSFGGQRVYSYNANADRAEHEALAKLDDRKTFAELLTVDMPGKIEVAKRLWTQAGDSDGAKAEIGAVDSFVKDNYDTLVTLTKYHGRDDLATRIAGEARDMISGAYKTDFLTMDRDPEIKAKVAQKRALDMGLNGDAADTYEKAVMGDADARALLSAAGASAIDQRPAGSGKGATPQAAKAAAAGVDPVDLNQFLSFAKTAYQTLGSSLGTETFGLLSASDRASVVRDSYTAAGPGAGQALLNIAAGAAATLTGQERADAFRSAVGVGTSALQAWGAGDDPAKRARGVKVLGALSAALPGAAFTANRQQVADTMTKVAGSLDSYRNAGVEFSDEAASTFAKVLFKRAYRPSEALTGEEGRVSGIMNRANTLGGNIMVSPTLADTGKEAPEKGGYDVLAGLLREHVQGASAAAMANGTTVDDEMQGRLGGLEQTLLALGVEKPEEARNAARLLTQVIASGGEVDVSRLPELLGNDPNIRGLVGRANAKDAELTANGGASVVTGEDALFAGAVARALEIERGRDSSSGVQRSPDELSAAARLAANSDSSVRMLKVIEDLRITPLSNPVGKVARGGAVALAYMRGVDYTPRPIAEVAKVLEPGTPSVMFETSPMYRYLYDTVPISELESSKTLTQAAGLIMDAYAEQNKLASDMSTKGALFKVAFENATRVAANIKAEASKLGADASRDSARQVLGSGDAEQHIRLARSSKNPGYDKYSSALWSAPTIAEARNLPGVTRTVSPEEVSRQLAAAVFDGSGDPNNDVSMTLYARRKLRDTLMLPAETTGRPPVTELGIDLTKVGRSEQVRSGYEALKKVSDRLGKPIRDAAVKKLVFQDLPRLMERMPNSDQMRGRRISIQMAYEGKSTDEIMDAFESSFAAAERRAAEAKKAAEAKVSVLGGAETDEAAPGVK